jgi:hypothetical protein
MAEPNISSTGSSTANTATRNDAQGRPAGGSRQSGQQHSSAERGGIVDRVKESATAQLTNQKNRGIDVLGSVTQAVRSSTQKLRDQRHDTIASYVDKAASQIESWTQRLKEKDIDELMNDVQQLARRRPAVFIGSAFALGLVAARFLKSSRQQNEYDYRSDSRRARYGGGSRMSTAANRSGPVADDEGGGVLVVEETLQDDFPLDEPSSPASSGGGRSSRARKGTPRTERS